MNINRFILLFLFPAFTPSFFLYSQSVQNIYTIDIERSGGSFSMDPNGNFTVITGSLVDSLGPYDGYITQFNTDGSVKINRRLDGGQREEVNAVCVGEGSYTYLAGSFLPGSGYDGLLSRFDSTGFSGWACKAGAAGSQEQLQALMYYTDSLGNHRLVAGGSTQQPLPGNSVDAWLMVSPSSFPSMTWNAVYAGPGDEHWNAVFFTSDNKIIAAGSTTAGGFGGKDILVASYYADGTPDWVRSYGGFGDDEALSVTERNGNVYVSGYTSDSVSTTHKPFVASINGAFGSLGNAVNYPSLGLEPMEAWYVTVGEDSTVYACGGGEGIESISYIMTLYPDLSLKKKYNYRHTEILKGCVPQADGSAWAGGLTSQWDSWIAGDFCLFHTNDTLGIDEGCGGGVFTLVENPSFSDTMMVDSSYLLTASIIVWNFDPYMDSTNTLDACALVHADDSAEENQLTLYPQPSASVLHLQFSRPLAADAEVAVYSLTGQRMCETQTAKAGSAESAMDVSAYPEGMYLLRVQTGEGEMVHRFVVTR